jgi:hypothetical protein
MEEVLLRQPEEVQRFLLHTCVLERLSGPLCDALLGVEDRTEADVAGSRAFSPRPSSLILQQLERANLFLVRLDEARQWYRYHHLLPNCYGTGCNCSQRRRRTNCTPGRMPGTSSTGSLMTPSATRCKQGQGAGGMPDRGGSARSLHAERAWHIAQLV